LPGMGDSGFRDKYSIKDFGQCIISIIEKEKSKLEDRWGRKVRGDQVLDIHGFPVIDKDDSDKEPAAAKS
ncbi:MAG: hypothetical protein AAF988_08460, partial [Pseudomonadota bacterium]